MAAPEIEIASSEAGVWERRRHAVQELVNCARENVMMDYLFQQNDWKNYVPKEAD